MKPALIVHGGAKEIPPEEAAAHREGCLQAARVGWDVLQRGGAALEAVEAATRVLEADGTFNAGYGAMLNPDGVVRLDAGIMDGEQLRVGAVACVEGVRYPISVARRLMDQSAALMVADYARQFAAEQELELCDPAALITEKQRLKWEMMRLAQSAHGENNTVGCVALDLRGNLAAGASTGGTGDKPPGRVGDSPLAGCGFHAENGVGASSFTGEGEAIIRIAGARTLREMLAGGLSPDEAARRVMDVLVTRTEGTGGCILIDGQGRIGWAHSDVNMAVAYMTADLDAPRAYLRKDEENR